MTSKEGGAEAAPRPLTPVELRIRERVKELMRREKYVGILSDEKFPRINLHFHFSSHATEEDAREFGKVVKQQGPTLIGLEYVNNTRQVKELFNKIAQGQMSPAELNFSATVGQPEFLKQLLTEIQGIKTPIVLLDFPADSEIAKQVTPLMQRFGGFLNELVDKGISFDEALKKFSEMIPAYMESIRAREQYSMASLEESIAQFIATDERFKKLKNINVTMLFGALHTPMAHNMRREHEGSEMRVQPSPFLFAPRDEMCRLVALGKEVPTDVRERAFIDHLLNNMLLEAFKMLGIPRDSTSMGAHRAIIESLTHEEMRKVYELYTVKVTQREAVAFLVDRMRTVLTDRGYTVSV
ncbi:MAG: hypothetical protein KBD05_02805 [Candidatus Pacebacteria bacterium]|nr:hypothetical protein [Candidatus Paceibacterota bacterium]